MSMCLLKALPGGPHDVFFVDRPGVKRFLERKGLIQPLFDSQDYVKSVTCSEDDVDLDLTPFRSHYSATQTLVESQAAYARAKGADLSALDSTQAWLQAEPSKASKGRILIAKSPRYGNEMFPYSQIVKHFGKRLMFIGLPQEHHDFQLAHGEVEHKKTKTMLEIAELAMGADLCIGNQSSPNSVWEGLKQPRVLSVSLSSVDCIFPGAHNAQYVAEGTMEFEDFKNPSYAFDTSQLNLREIPFNGWQYQKDGGPGKLVESSIGSLVRRMARNYGMTETEAQQEALRANIKRIPSHFARQINLDRFAKVKQALLNAGITEHPIHRLLGGQVTFKV